MAAQTYPDEMPLAELRTPELLLVTTLRLFAEGAWSGSPRDWMEGLAAAGLPFEGLSGFARMFEIIAMAPQRKLAVACMHCWHLSPDEGRFLQLFASLQRGHADDAAEILQIWAVPSAARLALPHAQAVADGLANQGYLLPRRAMMAEVFRNGAQCAGPVYLH